MYEVLVKGFLTKDEAEEFAKWYSEQGEQDAMIWLECAKVRGKDVRESLCAKSIVSTDYGAMLILK
jgi:hypothetical protein